MSAVREITIQRVHVATVRANGLPKGQPRPRAFARNGRASVYNPATAEGWKSCVAVACAPLEGMLLHDPLSVTLTFYMTRPKSHFKSNGTLKATSPIYMHDSKPDADNLAKAVLDAMTAIRVWLDDDQVCELVVRKYWEINHEGDTTHPPGCVICIQKMREVEL